MHIIAQIPGEGLATEVVDRSFETMGPAAGLLLVILVILVGVFWLASIWLKKQGKPKSTPVPAEPRTPGVSTMMGLMGLTAQDVRNARAAPATLTGMDAAQEVEIRHLKERLDKSEKERKGIWRDMVKLSNRLAKLEVESGRVPGGTGMTSFELSDEDDAESEGKTFG